MPLLPYTKCVATSVLLWSDPLAKTTSEPVVGDVCEDKRAAYLTQARMRLPLKFSNLHVVSIVNHCIIYNAK